MAMRRELRDCVIGASIKCSAARFVYWHTPAVHFDASVSARGSHTRGACSFSHIIDLSACQLILGGRVS